MIPSNTVVSPAFWAMLGVCVLGVGFMIRFLIALTREARMPVAYLASLKPVEHPAGTGPSEELHHAAWAAPAAYLSRGIARIRIDINSLRPVSRQHRRPTLSGH